MRTGATHLPRDPRLEKAAVREKVESIIGPTRQEASRRPDWLVSTNRRTSVFITFSKIEQLFYDVNEADVADWRQFPRSFVIFVLGSADSSLVMPVEALEKHVLKRIRPKERGNFKLHIVDTGRYRFDEVSYFDATPYHNNFWLLSETEHVPSAT